ncbi:MAG: hypothetical protein ACYCQI_08570 [Gammaproteobacteria bacterium]
MLLPKLSLEEIHLKEKKIGTICNSLYLVPLEYKLQKILDLTQALENAAIIIRRKNASLPAKNCCLPGLWNRSNKILPESKTNADKKLHFFVKDAYSLEEEFADNIKLLLMDTLNDIGITADPINKKVYKDIIKTFKFKFDQNLEEGYFKPLKMALRDESCLFSHYVKRCYSILDADVKLKSVPKLLSVKKLHR